MCVCVCVWVGGCVLVGGCVHVCVGSMDSQTAEWILMKLCRHDPCIPTTVFCPKTSENVTPCGEKGIFNFPLQKTTLKSVAQWLKRRSLKLKSVVQTWTRLIFSSLFSPLFLSFFLSFFFFPPPLPFPLPP